MGRRRIWPGAAGRKAVTVLAMLAASVAGAMPGGTSPATAATVTPPAGLRLAYFEGNRYWIGAADGTGAVGTDLPFVGPESLRFSPDGTRFAAGFDQPPPGAGLNHSGGVRLWSDQAAEQGFVASGPGFWGSDWSPDGLRLAYTSYAGLRIAELGRYPSTSRTVGATTTPTSLTGVSWNPVTSAIAVAEDPTYGSGSKITVRQPDGSGARTLVPATAVTQDPAWSPDGSELAYVRHDPAGGPWSLFMVSADGTATRQVTSSLTNVADPSWAPDGRSILVADLVPGGRLASKGIVRVDVLTGASTPVTSGNHRHPVLTTRTVPHGADGYGVTLADGGAHGFGAGSSLPADPATSAPKVASTPRLQNRDGAVLPCCGTWATTAKGEVFAAGLLYEGGAPPGLAQPVVGIASSPVVSGYWLVARDGGVFSFGSGVGFFGSTGGLRLNKPIVGMAATADGRGYWLVAADGGIFSFGDAPFLGSTGGLRLNQPVVGMAATPDGGGYWLVTADGGVFTFGDARFSGSLGAVRLNRPIVAMTPTWSGAGYWLLGADGGAFTFGEAHFYGSTAGSGGTAIGIQAPPRSLP